MAGPAVGRLHSGRPGEIKEQPKLVDALSGASADAGSIPAASTFWLNRADLAVSFGRNDFVLPLLFQPTGVRLHRSLEVGLVAMVLSRASR
jgi:hypothetical protein